MTDNFDYLTFMPRTGT